MKFRKFSLFSVATAVALVAGSMAQTAQKPRLTPRFDFSPLRAAARTAAPLAQAASTPGLPLWTFNVRSSRDGNQYTGVMVGSNPFSDDSRSTHVTTQIIPIIFKTHTVGTTVNAKGIIATAPGDTTFNPTVPDRGCLGSHNNNPLRLFQQSPIFNPADFNYGGTDVGFTQQTDAFQRANFWNVISRNYHVTLGPVNTFGAVVVDVPAANGLALATTALGPPAFCAPMAIVDGNLFDLFINNNILPAFASRGVNHGTFPVFLLYNAVLSDGDPTNLINCCILGYHGIGNSDPTQTYSPMDFDETGLFGISGLDTATASHEAAEWMDDPFGDNPTPAWGHTGQVPGCQGNLEVGDPLSGTEAPRIVMPNGFTYHLQELAFFSWFYQSRSIGIHGWFSDNGTFLSNAGPVCQ